MAEGGIEAIHIACQKIGERVKAHLKVYGEGYEMRLTGRHETCRYDEFRYGVADRTASIRIPAHVAAEEKGYLEDRRPCANICPYEVAQVLLAESGCRWLLVTRGNLGMALFGEGLPEGGAVVEASGRGDVTDVCGAGDTAASVFTLGLAAGVDPALAMAMANAASGVVVRERGAAVCKPQELEEALQSSTAPVLLGSARAL